MFGVRIHALVFGVPVYVELWFASDLLYYASVEFGNVSLVYYNDTAMECIAIGWFMLKCWEGNSIPNVVLDVAENIVKHTKNIAVEVVEE